VWEYRKLFIWGPRDCRAFVFPDLVGDLLLESKRNVLI
jgi:hypothetical protein